MLNNYYLVYSYVFDTLIVLIAQVPTILVDLPVS